LGPAFIAAVAYIDPGNFATNIAGGAQYGYTLLWVIVASNLMAMLIQTLSAKLGVATRSEEHTSELQSLTNLVCRLLLEKKTHTTLPLANQIMDRNFMIVTDEEVGEKLTPTPNSFLWLGDINEETRPLPIANFMISYHGECEPVSRLGAHHTAEQVYDNIHYVTWFAGGLRALDLSNPFAPKEVGYYVPLPGKGQMSVQSNAVSPADYSFPYHIALLN